jgi:hypothetical protein
VSGFSRTVIRFPPGDGNRFADPVVFEKRFPIPAVRPIGAGAPVQGARDVPINTYKTGGRYRVDYAKIPAVIQKLAKELLEQEATGDRARAEAWFTKYDLIPPPLKQALDAARDVPIDVDPIGSFDETVR